MKCRIAMAVTLAAILAGICPQKSSGATNVATVSERLLAIRVQTADGTPLTNATVVCAGLETNVVLSGRTIQGGRKRFQTDSHGSFTLKWDGSNIALIVSADEGFCLAQSRDIMDRPVLTVRPWARIDGARTDHGRPLAQQRLALDMIGRGVDPLISNLIDMREETTTDSNGHFVFSNVPPIELWLEDLQPWEGANAQRSAARARVQEIDLQPGEARRVNAATQGRKVVGRIEPDPKLTGVVDLKSLDSSLARGIDPEGYDSRKRPWVPAEYDTAERRAKWYLDWFESSEEGRQRKIQVTRFRAVMIHADGSFVCETVEPGAYRISGSLYGNHRTIAELEALHFVVPPAQVGAETAPVDIGKVILKPVVDLRAGDLAPDFTAPTLDGSSITLSAMRGKYVLLDFWATWCGPCVAENPNLKSTYDAFGKDSRFVMISLSSDSDQAAPKKFVKEHEIAWSQAFLGGDWEKDLAAQAYGVTAIPQILLVGPDGKIVARDLRGTKIKEAVGRALKAPEK